MPLSEGVYIFMLFQVVYTLLSSIRLDACMNPGAAKQTVVQWYTTLSDPFSLPPRWIECWLCQTTKKVGIDNSKFTWVWLTGPGLD